MAPLELYIQHILEGPLRWCCCISPPLPLSSSLHPCHLSHGLSRSPLAALWVCLLPAAPPCTLCFTCLMTLLSSQLLFLNISQVQSLSCPKPSTSSPSQSEGQSVHGTHKAPHDHRPSCHLAFQLSLEHHHTRWHSLLLFPQPGLLPPAAFVVFSPTSSSSASEAPHQRGLS